jgi:hypothetical protein
MKQLFKWIGCLGLVASLEMQTGAFSLLGPLKNAANGAPIPWQGTGFGGRPNGLGYELAGDIGGPMNPLEGYRWNIPVVTYAFDPSFLRYFGTNGVNAVEEAFAILNALPPASAMSDTLSEFPLDTKTINHTAATLGLLDLKSHTLTLLLEELGLANPERFVWGVRDRRTGNAFTNYSVIQLNYDPVTIQESRYVNGVLYNYRVFDDIGPIGGEWASAVEWYQLDPLFIPYSSVMSGGGHNDFELGSAPDDISGVISGLATGEFFRGLTRDDVGGLRFLLSTNNIVVEGLLPDVVPGTGFVAGGGTQSGSPWTPFPPFTNNIVTNTPPPPPTNTTQFPASFVQGALRPGVDKITFQRVNYDSLLGTTFTPVTHRYTDRYVNATTGRIAQQRVQRTITQPDILFAVGDLGTFPITATPILSRRTDTTGWSNNVALNTQIPNSPLSFLGGPGVITPGIFIRYSDLVPYFINDVPGGQDIDAFRGSIWGSFDGSDRPPVVYPVFAHPLLPNLSLQFLQNVALGGNN